LHLHPLAKISKELYHFYKVIKKKFVMHKCSPAMQQVLPVATSSAIHCNPSRRYITVEALGVCDHVTVYASFTHQSTVLSRKTPMQNYSENMLF
jgi:hypothetical protein